MSLRVFRYMVLLLALLFRPPGRGWAERSDGHQAVGRGESRSESVLKYWLLPELKDMQPGNPVPAYNKVFMFQNNLFYNKQNIEDREKWSLPAGRSAETEGWYGGWISKQADYAARLDACDWQILNNLKTDGSNLLLPDVQQLCDGARFEGPLSLANQGGRF